MCFLISLLLLLLEEKEDDEDNDDDDDDVVEAIEGVGGIFNGSTGKELTSYIARVPAEQWPIVMHVLADMIRHPLFDPIEIEKERSVIIEELSATHDDPQEWTSLLIGGDPFA